MGESGSDGVRESKKIGVGKIIAHCLGLVRVFLSNRVSMGFL